MVGRVSFWWCKDEGLRRSGFYSLSVVWGKDTGWKWSKEGRKSWADWSGWRKRSRWGGQGTARRPHMGWFSEWMTPTGGPEETVSQVLTVWMWAAWLGGWSLTARRTERIGRGQDRDLDPTAQPPAIKSTGQSLIGISGLLWSTLT